MEPLEPEQLRARIAELERLVFSRGGTDDPSAIGELERLSRTLEVQTAHDATNAPAPGPASDAPFTSVTDQPAGLGELDDVEAPHPRRACTRVLVASVSAAAIGGVLLGVTLGNVLPGGGNPDEPVIVEISGPAFAPEDIRALDIFDEPQVQKDIVARNLPSTLRSASTRSLVENLYFAFEADSAAERVYVALSSGNQPCLVAVSGVGDVSYTCVSVNEFGQYGMRLAWTSTAEVAVSEGGTAIPLRMVHTVRWTAAGESSVESVPIDDTVDFSEAAAG